MAVAKNKPAVGRCPTTVDALAPGSAKEAEAPPAPTPAQLQSVVSFLTFVDTFTVGLTNPIYPILVQSDIIGATAYAGIMSAANAAALGGSTIFGRLSDVHGRRAAIMASTSVTFLGFACYVIGFACEGVHAPTRLILPAAGRIIGGMGRAALAAPLLAMLAEFTSGASTGAMTARTMATFGFGFAFGSGAGGLLFSRGGAMLNLCVIALCATMQVAVAWRFLPTRNAAAATAPPATESNGAADVGCLAALRTALALRSTRALLILQAIAAASFHTYDSTSALYVGDALGYSASQRGYILSYAGWMFALQTFFIVPRLVAMRGSSPSRLLCGALLATAVGRLGLATASSATVNRPTLMIALSYPILNLGQGMTHTLLKTLMAQAASENTRGLMLGALGSVDKSFGVLGPLIGGPAYDALGPAAPANLSALLALIGLVAAMSLTVVESGATRRATDGKGDKAD